MRSTSSHTLLVLRGTNGATRFLLELSALAALAVWGFTSPRDIAIRLLLGIAAPGAAAILWGLFVAPRARFPLTTVGRSSIELLVFGSASLAIFASGPQPLAVGFAAVALGNMVLTNYWHQWEAARSALNHPPRQQAARDAA
jgi:hypothetical protein